MTEPIPINPSMRGLALWFSVVGLMSALAISGMTECPLGSPGKAVDTHNPSADRAPVDGLRLPVKLFNGPETVRRAALNRVRPVTGFLPVPEEIILPQKAIRPPQIMPAVSIPVSAKQNERDNTPPAPAIKKKVRKYKYNTIIDQAAQRHQIEPAIIQAIIMAESSFNPDAISRKGAKGLMQLMPKTAEALGVIDIFNPEHNINAGAKYFKQLLNQFKGDLVLALAAYNAGSQRVKKFQGIPPIDATRSYVKKVMEYYQQYKARLVDTDSKA